LLLCLVTQRNSDGFQRQASATRDFVVAMIMSVKFEEIHQDVVEYRNGRSDTLRFPPCPDSLEGLVNLTGTGTGLRNFHSLSCLRKQGSDMICCAYWVEIAAAAWSPVKLAIPRGDTT
jgi:hypothetical protein